MSPALGTSGAGFSWGTNSVTSPVSFDDIVNGLRDLRAYSWQPETVEVIETHISWVFLAGDRVLKLKRPVDYGFVDYSTLELRHTACEDEVRLNRRLTQGIYLGVARITAVGDRIFVDGDGEPVEWATLMRRLPANGMLDVMLGHGTVAGAIVERIADRLIIFHSEGAERCGGELGSAVQLARVILDNLTDLEPFAGNPLPPVQLGHVIESMRKFGEEGHELLATRVREGWIREGHGDLRTDHICFDEQGEIQIFDCVEFSKGIRCADIASDVAFLLVDLDRLGASQIADEITRRYWAAKLELPTPILRFYRGHRALVKVKVSCISWRDLPQDDRQAFFEGAMTYLDLATSATSETRPVMIAMTGLSGTGKSVVSMALARALGAKIISTDDLRKRISGNDGPPAGWQTGRYAPAARATIYDVLFQKASELVLQGKPVILDATFLESASREAAASAARDADVPLVFVETVADDPVVRRRLDARSKRGDSASEATVEIYERQLQAMRETPPPIPQGAEHVRIDTSQDGPVNLDDIYSLLIGRNILRPGISLS